MDRTRLRPLSGSGPSATRTSHTSGRRSRSDPAPRICPMSNSRSHAPHAAPGPTDALDRAGHPAAPSPGSRGPVDSVCDAGVELIPTTVGMLLGQLLGCDLGRRASAARDQLHYNRSRSAPGGIRTPNLLIRSQMLYPLSYRRMFSCSGATGVTVLLAPAGGSRGNPRKDQPARKRRDLNPRCSCPHNTLAVCPIRPLWHASQGHPREATGS